ITLDIFVTEFTRPKRFLLGFVVGHFKFPFQNFQFLSGYQMNYKLAHGISGKTHCHQRCMITLISRIGF
ncbi:MAG: hypothetical protein LBJ59_00065, partial [Zoogloeaceae bacterium]|nr:hypothetical protein [Zoogloeaceae bacterium]